MKYKIIIPKEEPKQRLEKYSERFDKDKSPKEEPEYILCGEANKFYRCVNCDSSCGIQGHYVKNKKTSKITRVEVIQHSPPYNGRAYVK